MNIGIDVRPLASGPYTGVANVVRHLLPPLFALADNDRLVLLFLLSPRKRRGGAFLA